MSEKKQSIGKISGKVIMTSASGKLNRNDGAVKSGTGYHKSVKDYNRKGKTNQRLKNKLKDYGSPVVFIC